MWIMHGRDRIFFNRFVLCNNLMIWTDYVDDDAVRQHINK